MDRGLFVVDTDFRKYLGVGKTVWNNWCRQYADQKPRDVYMSSHPMVVGEKPKEPEVIEADYNSEAYLNDQTDKVDLALIQACESNNAQALKIYYQLTKRLIEKQEVTHKLDGSFITREILRAGDELESEGVAQVPEKPPTLLPKVCPDTGQGEKGNNKV